MGMLTTSKDIVIHIVAWEIYQSGAVAVGDFQQRRHGKLIVEISWVFLFFLIPSRISSQPGGISSEIPLTQSQFIRTLLLAIEAPWFAPPHQCQSKIIVQKSVQSTPQKVNINRANVEELKKLPGIGSKLAQRIVTFRSQNPPFRKVEELLIIKGVNHRLLERIRPWITVE
jgi:competence ComEA-like helix-hairpin-helix protein